MNGLHPSLIRRFELDEGETAVPTVFTVVHDAAHKTLSRNALINESFGVVAAFVLCGPFEAVRRNHLHHHARTNDTIDDPDFWVAGETWLSTGMRCLTTLQAHYWSYLTRLRRRDGVLIRALSTLSFIIVLHRW